MKKYLILFLFSCLFSFSQIKKDSINISFENENLITVVNKIEKESNCKIYYDTKWLDNEKKTITASFKNTTLDKILTEVFANTKINFYVDSDRIILMENRIIYDYFTDDYFINQNNQNIVQSTAIENKRNPNEELIYIGKNTKNIKNKTFTIKGNVKNVETNNTVKNTIVRINKNLSTTTDSNGAYSIEVPAGLVTLTVEVPNASNNSKKLFVSENGTIDFFITEKTIGIKEVVITTKIQNKIKSTTTGATTIDLENMKNVPILLGEQDVFKIATIMPGIKTAGEGATGLNVRGGNADQNLILVDDISLYNPFHFLGFFSSINPYSLKNVTIYKGSIPVEYGGRLSSVMDLKTKKPNASKLSGEGGIGPVTSNVFLNVPVIKEKSALATAFRATYSDWILKSLDEEQLKNSNASFYDFSLKYSHDINPKNTINTLFYYSNDKFRITSDSLFKYNNRLVGINWEHKFSKKADLAVLLNNSDYKYGVDYSNHKEELNSFKSGFNINETNLQVKQSNKINQFINLDYGISGKLYKINPGFLTPKDENSILTPKDIIDEKALESSIFFKNEAKINTKLVVNIGLRYTNYSFLGPNTQRIYENGLPKNEATLLETKNYKNNEVIKQYGGLEPRISARYMLTNSLAIKGSYDKTYQYIHLLSTNTTQTPTDVWKLSDINVKPQIGEQYSLGLYKNINEIYEISLEGYTKRSKNILDYKTGATIILSDKIETELLQGEGKSYGIELLIKKSIGKLNGWIAYTYSRSFIKLDSPFRDEKVNNGEYFATNFDKPHDFNSVLNYKITKRYSFSMNFVYQTGRPITYPIGKYTYGNAEYTLYSDRNKFRIPDYYRVDFSFNIEGSHKIKKLAHSFWNISVYNLLGRNNPYSIYFITENGQVKGYKTSIFSIPIPTITYNFKF
ncbi:Probable TonB-dependent outer membrane receptor precursor [Flavobacterium indicum GPTSA100-9 = DSM 17447]|uniref:Probable TonB-dependent outer membrane receptor n=1 Tax=Flavobacterium indicum (strain DSM 17447 / CIP 109464 / GPTSA100-9) TaxID=1094466 RepID=H8XPX9_FLAIG|nr:TonB-dependent receptor [Flavobacterium indicum]CCG54195.1 Probable TonB-dependent outer membrane receptor precursor [Flavobacterium indicum GPTSA100-9 = DSM 17447]